MASDAQLTRIHERIDDLGKDLNARLGAINENLARVSERCPMCQQDICNLQMILNGPPGNGTRPGVVLRLTSVEKAHDELEEAVKGRYRRAQKVAFYCATGIGAMLLTIGGAALNPLFQRLFGG